MTTSLAAMSFKADCTTQFISRTGSQAARRQISSTWVGEEMRMPRFVERGDTPFITPRRTGLNALPRGRPTGSGLRRLSVDHLPVVVSLQQSTRARKRAMTIGALTMSKARFKSRKAAGVPRPCCLLNSISLIRSNMAS